MSSKLSPQFLKKILGITEKPRIGLVEVSLQDAVSATQGALDAEIENPVAATAIVTRPRARLQKATTKAHHFKDLRFLKALVREPFNHLKRGMWQTATQ